MSDLSNGCLIVFEGIDGVGKTTQLKLAEETLSKSWPVVTRRNLGSTPIGEALRTLMTSPIARPPEADLYMSAAIQAALIEQTEKDRQASKLILMDRGPMSLAAYAIFGGELSQNLGWPHVDEGMSKLAPDLTIIYTADISTALQRARQQTDGPDYYESKPLDYFERVKKGYQTAANRYQHVVIVDASQPIDAIHVQTMSLINDTLAKFS